VEATKSLPRISSRDGRERKGKEKSSRDGRERKGKEKRKKGELAAA
jgi:hypothetical protein